MTNYNTLTHNLKRGILKFSEKITKNFSRPEFKFVSQMIYGMLSSQSCMLSEIARKLDEKTLMKKVVERLSRNLKNFKEKEKLFENYLKAVKSQINERTILIIDGSDISKTYSKKMESLGTVRDGSTGEYTKGYHTLGVTALTPEKKMPICVYNKIYSSEEKEFISEDTEVLKCFEFLTKHFKKKNIRALDRGYDNNKYYEYFINNKEKFVIRAKKNRDVIHNGEKINILELAKKYKGKYKLDYQRKNSKKVTCKVSIVPIKLKCRPDDELNLVICYGFKEEPMMLITNLKSDDKRLPIAVVKVYLMRWKIEEFYRFKKQQFGYENFRVRSLEAIRTLDLLLTIAIGYLGVISENSDERQTTLQLIQHSKRIYGANKFVFYAIADGLFFVISKCKSSIYDMLKKKPKSMQLSFLEDSVFGWC